MRPATDDEVRAACLTRSSTDAAAYLLSIGQIATRSRCNVMISRMIADGERGHVGMPGRTMPTDAGAFTEAACRLGSLRLHEATERLFVRMAERDGTTVVQAALTAHFGAEQAARWAA